jgi:hypothetical protein
MDSARVAGVLVALLLAATPASARRIVPPTIELDGCVLPSPACSETRDIVKMVVDDGRRVEFAVQTLRLLSTTSATSGKVLNELQLRGLRVHGPKELTQELEAGARRRVRGLLRPPSYLLLQAVEPLDEKR